MDDRQLVALAYAARDYSYSPYSGFRVGAALLTASGRVYSGCNVESASYSATNCAERTAFFKAVSEGEREFRKIAVVGGRSDGHLSGGGYTPPCGVCLQVMAEFCRADSFEILLAAGPDEPYRRYLLGELLPLGFGAAQMK